MKDLRRRPNSDKTTLNYLPKGLVGLFGELLGSEVVVIHFLPDFFQALVSLLVVVFDPLFEGLLDEFPVGFFVGLRLEVVLRDFVFDPFLVLIYDFLVEEFGFDFLLPLQILLVEYVRPQMVVVGELRQLLRDFVLTLSLLLLLLFLLVLVLLFGLLEHLVDSLVEGGLVVGELLAQVVAELGSDLGEGLGLLSPQVGFSVQFLLLLVVLESVVELVHVEALLGVHEVPSLLLDLSLFIDFQRSLQFLLVVLNSSSRLF